MQRNLIFDYTIEEDYKKVEMPESMVKFLKDVDEVCKKHNLSISHEDGHGAFLIERYNKNNIEWLFNACKCYRD